MTFFFDNVHDFKDKHKVQVQPALLYDRKLMAQKQIWIKENEDLESMLPGKTCCQTDRWTSDIGKSQPCQSTRQRSRTSSVLKGI